MFYGGSGRQLACQIVGVLLAAAWSSFWATVLFGGFSFIDSKRKHPLFSIRSEDTFEVLDFGTSAASMNSSSLLFSCSFLLLSYYLCSRTNSPLLDVLSLSLSLSLFLSYLFATLCSRISVAVQNVGFMMPKFPDALELTNMESAQRASHDCSDSSDSDQSKSESKYRTHKMHPSLPENFTHTSDSHSPPMSDRSIPVTSPPVTMPNMPGSDMRDRP